MRGGTSQEHRPVPYFDDMILGKILSLLDDDELLEKRVLSHSARNLIDTMLRTRFIERWGICSIERPPPSPVAYVDCQLRNFAFTHYLESSAESLPTLAVRYNVQLTALRRLNNILNDRALCSRTAVLIPAAESDVRGALVSFQNSSIASRPLWIVGAHGSSENGEQRTSFLRSHRTSSRSMVEHNILLLMKALKLDRESASFYLLQSEGDLKSAILAYRDDMQWVNNSDRHQRNR